MKRTLLAIIFITSIYHANAQKTADREVVFETKSNSLISYSGIGLEVYLPSGYYKDLGGFGLGVSLEGYKPLTKKLALTPAFSYKHFEGGDNFFGYKTNSIDLTLGLHKTLFGGFYVKPIAGVAYTESTFDDDYSDSIIDFTYGLQVGSLFKTKNDNFIDIGILYREYAASGAFLGIQAKYLFQKKK